MTQEKILKNIQTMECKVDKAYLKTKPLLEFLLEHDSLARVYNWGLLNIMCPDCNKSVAAKELSHSCKHWLNYLLERFNDMFPEFKEK